jgi:hypothetical protein
MAVTNPETDGLSFTIFTFAPGTLLPKHRHNVDYIEFVLAGEVHHGNRVLGPGQGVYRAAGTQYSFWAGPDGATIADFRAHTFYTTEHEDAPEEFPPTDSDGDPLPRDKTVQTKGSGGTTGGVVGAP